MAQATCLRSGQHKVMAVYRLEAKVISRAKGRSATASAAYRAGSLIEDQRTGQTFDYTNKRGVLHSEILAPSGTPDWMHDRAMLWNAVEKVEKRRDAQLARDFILSLPHELTHGQRVELLRDFLGTDFVAQGMIADFSVHAPDRQSDDRNHHAHVMVTMRELTAGGFGLKVREWNATEQLELWRERWADTVNHHLEQHGHETRVDHRSLADQGIDREPEPKQGPTATKMERQGRQSNAGDDRRDAQGRNEQRAAFAAELAALSSEIGDLIDERSTPAEQGRPTPSAGQQASEPPDVEIGDQERERPSVGTTKAGIVAQQTEALDRFRRNSKSLEAQREERLRALDQAVEEQADRARQDRTLTDLTRPRGDPDRSGM